MLSGDEPDFDALGRQTLWSAETWRRAWNHLEHQGALRTKLWEHVEAMVAATVGGPFGCADALTKALVDPPGRPNLFAALAPEPTEGAGEGAAVAGGGE